MSSPSKATHVTKDVDEGLKKVGRALAGGNTSSIAKAVISHSGIRECIVDRVIDVINEECNTLCRKSMQPNSLFRQLQPDQIDVFSWG